MKSVLISVQPKWCEKIIHIIGQKGTKPIYEKSVEIRKTKPKIYTPFKCYIYCTNSKKEFLQSRNNVLFYCEDKDFIGGHGAGLYKRLNGKVIGEFVCDEIQEYESEFVDNDCLETIVSIDRDEDGDATGFIEWSNDSDISYINTDFFKKCCVKYNEIKKYMGMGFVTFYGWHISDLVIYDKPKELGEFRKSGALSYDDWLYGIYNGKTESSYEKYLLQFTVTIPPQSWCYVERKEDEGK